MLDRIKLLQSLGYRRIASDAHAAQLLRRELKHHARWQQRDPTRVWDYRHLLEIQKGNWFKVMRNRKNGYCSIVIWKVKSTNET